MQLKEGGRGRSIGVAGSAEVGAALAAATCALLGTGAPAPAVAQEIGHWTFDAAGLYYGEGDGRVRDLSVDVLAKTQAFEDKYLTLNFSFDTLTGASPNGAAPSASPQIFVRPVTLTRSSGGATVRSGGGSFIVAPGELPVDPSFKDTRFAGSLDWQQPLGRLTTITFGGSASAENDYTHFGLDARFARDFNERNTTLSAGVEWSDDLVKPIGGSPTPFTPVTSAAAAGDLGLGTGGGNHAKHVVDALVGITQVLSPRTIMQINYSVDNADGYLTDPYKFMSVVDAATGDLLPGPDVGTGLYLYENRPSSRQKRSLYGLIKRDIAGDVVDFAYRRMTDDWGIDSRTAELHVRFNFGDDKYLQPHLRFYSQTAANFYHTVLLGDQSLPEFASADYRLGAFDAVTAGLKFGTKTTTGEFASRLEVYRQSGKPDPSSLVGSLADLKLYPDLKAVILEFSYKFGL